MSSLSLSNSRSFMGEMKVFDVGRTQKAKQGDENLSDKKFPPRLFNYFLTFFRTWKSQRQKKKKDICILIYQKRINNQKVKQWLRSKYAHKHCLLTYKCMRVVTHSVLGTGCRVTAGCPVPPKLRVQHSANDACSCFCYIYVIYKVSCAYWL